MCLPALTKDGCLGELPVHVGQRKEGRKEKGAREFDPHLSF